MFTDLDFTVHLVSSASMDVFHDNTLSSFRNQLAQPLQLDGEWQVALESIIFPTSIKNVTSTRIREYSSSDLTSVVTLGDGFGKIRRTGNNRNLKDGMYSTVEEILAELKNGSSIQKFEFALDPVTRKLTVEFGPREGISFEDEQIPSILGFELKTEDYTSYLNLGYMIDPILYSLASVPNKHTGQHPVDITSGSQLIFVYLDIIDFQHVGDVKAPILKIIETVRRLKNGSLIANTPNYNRVITNLDFKRVIANSIQNIKVELRSETGKLIAFTGVGKVVLNLKFRRVK